MGEQSRATSRTVQQMEEARLMVRIREAHSKALLMAASKLKAEVFHQPLQTIKGKVDVDAAALAVKMVERVVERSEEGFKKLCERKAVNEKLLAQERRQQRLETGSANGIASRGEQLDFLAMVAEISPLPGGRQPAELVRETTIRLKLAERERLLALAEEVERQADAEEAIVADIEATLERKLEEVAETQQALTEAARCLP